jgi:predicted nucleic-acid-binding Zn-ribbon protein
MPFKVKLNVISVKDAWACPQCGSSDYIVLVMTAPGDPAARKCKQCDYNELLLPPYQPAR